MPQRFCGRRVASREKERGFTNSEYDTLTKDIEAQLYLACTDQCQVPYKSNNN